MAIIGCWFGDGFSDNSKYLYLQNYFKFDVPKLKMIWITDNKEIYELLKSKNLPAVMRKSFLTLWYGLRVNII